MRHNIYFAYGSNLHLSQMAKRCPESRLLGIGRLHGFRWQINQRGYANVVAEGESFVEGICYLLSNKDEADLDCYEGVDAGAYEKRIIDIEVICQPAALIGRDVAQLVDDGSLALQRAAVSNAGHNMATEDKTLVGGLSGGCRSVEANEECGMLRRRFGLGKAGEIVQALVYLTTTYTRDGYPQNEYIGRMNMGLDDAVAIGIPRTFIDGVIRTCLQARQKDESS